MSALFLEQARNVLFPSHVQLDDDLLNCGPCPTWRSGKTLPAVRLTTHKLMVSVDAVVGVELLATTPAGKHMATVLPNFVLARQLQRLESFVTDITGVNPLSLVLCHPPPKLIPSSNNINSLTTLPSAPAGQGASR